MTLVDPQPLVAQYRAGLEAEMALLRRLQALAVRQQAIAGSTDLLALDELTDARDAIVASLVAIESDLRPLRETLASARTLLAQDVAFGDVVALHDEAGRLVADILAADAASRAALQQAEATRRLAAQALDRGEHTLAAYRRVLAPGLAHAALVNRRG